MQEILYAMLRLQDKLNLKTIGTAWSSCDEYDWFLAISQECAEGIDALAWKWWAKQVPDLPAARIEVVDILHFALSAEMWIAPKDASTDDIAEVLAESYKNRLNPLAIDTVEFAPEQETPLELFRIISALATVGRNDVGLIFLLGEKLGLTPDALSILYRQKATLNLFRQNNGYRDGTYIKHWAPSVEDNAFLDVLSAGLDWSTPDAQETLYYRLNVKYREITDAIVKH